MSIRIIPSFASCVLERFFRSGGTQSSAAGFGIGLALARNLVTAQRGTLTLDPFDPTARAPRFTISLKAGVA